MDVNFLKIILDNLITSSMREVRDNKDLLDSFSPNQFKSKLNLINHIESLDILNKDSEVVIFGCWYGSILIPAFYNKVKRITGIDLNTQVISRNKYNLYPDSNNMYDIHDSINCVKSMDEFRKQLPNNTKILIEDEVPDDRGTRFTIIGKYEIL